MTVDNRLQLLGTHNSPVVSPVFGDSGDLYVMEEFSCGEIFRYMGIDEFQHPNVPGEPDPSTEIRIAPCGPFSPLDVGCGGFVIQSPPEREQGSSPAVALTTCDMANGALVKVTRTLGDSGTVPSGEVGKVNSEALMVPMDLGADIEKAVQQSHHVLVEEYEGAPLLGPHSVALCPNSGFIFFTDSGGSIAVELSSQSRSAPGPCGESSLSRPLGSVFAIGPTTGMLLPLAVRSLAYPTGLAVTQRQRCPNSTAATVLYAAETMNNRVLRFVESPAGSGCYHASVFHQLSGRLGPVALAVSAAGHLFIAHNDIGGLSSTGRIVVLDEEGQLLSTISLPYPNITGLAVSPDQNGCCVDSTTVWVPAGGRGHTFPLMFHTTRQLLGPPKAPRNVFFPWFNFVVHRSGMYLEPNRIAFRVPVHLTKLEIREYLRKIYGVKAIRCTTVVRFPKVMKNRARAYYKNGAQFKKAIVTCEETIPNSVKMLSSSSTPHLNPAIHRNKLSMQYDYIPYRFGQDRKNDWKPRHRHAWREPIPLLLRGDHGHPTITKREEMALRMDTTLPHQDVMNTKKAMLDGTPKQLFPRIDLAEIRRRKYAFQHQYDHLKGSENVHIEEPAEGGPDQEPLFRL
ncbi:hypothetical protein FOZ61_000772 [Perkinsus olseni]|uniref:Large ribosomal subunit protein uL23m n=1 Tax=Perkinsus olseni TaxID=32597 RepID=A0A7J6LZ00_PEROL|nr:hypothetical protein FOZ61_000772 [Perkinsus olseni]